MWRKKAILHGKHAISAYTEMAQQPVFKSKYINGNYYTFTYTAQLNMVVALPVVSHNKINSSGFSSALAFLPCLSFWYQSTLHTKTHLLAFVYR